jgi:hypothetical protein
VEGHARNQQAQTNRRLPPRSPQCGENGDENQESRDDTYSQGHLIQDRTRLHLGAV